MTRSFNHRLDCPHCRIRHTAETAFERWMRCSGALDSSLGIVRYDLDILVHRYLFPPTDHFGQRELQAMMFVEVKCAGADVTPSQQDTLSVLSQVLRNRHPNMHRDKRGMHAENHTPLACCYSRYLNKDVHLRMFGGHLLQLSGTSPEDSDTILWDYKEIDVETLLRVLRFDLDPDTIEAPDWRRRSYRADNGYAYVEPPRPLLDDLPL